MSATFLKFPIFRLHLKSQVVMNSTCRLQWITVLRKAWLPFPVNVFKMIWNGRAKPRPHRYAPKNPNCHTDCYMANSNPQAIDWTFLFFDCYNLNGALDHGCPILFYSSSCTRLASMSFVKEQVFYDLLYLKSIVTVILFSLSEVFVAISACLYFLFVVFS